MRFWKLQAIGNDFALLHADEIGGYDGSGLAVVLCERRFGIGADGLLVLGRDGDRDLRLTMFNPDGSEDFCGNGLRCAAWHAKLQGWVEGTFRIEHGGRSVPAAVFADETIEVEIGMASSAPSDVPIDRTSELFDAPLTALMPGERPATADWRLSSISTGSTHTVIATPELPDDELFFRYGPLLEHHSLFPERTSVIWMKETGDSRVSIRIWERGAGETLGCGTGSAAAASVYLRTKGTGGTVEVVSKGGAVQVGMEAWHGPIRLRSRAEQTYTGQLAPEVISTLSQETAASPPAFLR